MDFLTCYFLTSYYSSMVRSTLFLSPLHVFAIFSVLKINCLFTYPLMWLANSRVEDAMLPIMAKHAEI